jgi:uncharacterized protein involved in outer membrane biogenesis
MNKLTKTQNIIITLIAALIISIALGEYLGWPFLATPLERQLSSLMNRQVSFGTGNMANLPGVQVSQANTPSSQKSQAFHVKFLGGLVLKTAKLNIAAPDWSTKPHFIDGRNVLLKLRYSDIWRAYRGYPLRIKVLQAQQLDANLERQAGGRASWQFRDKPTNKPVRFPSFDQLLLTDGTLYIEDVPLQSNIEAKLSLVGSAADRHSDALKTGKLTVTASGQYQGLPLKIELESVGAPTADQASTKFPAQLSVNATVDRSHLKFRGKTHDILHPSDFSGDFDLSGPSLAAVGDLVDVTLPTTEAFKTNGTVEKQGLGWRARFDDVAIGDSRLNGRFSYDKSLATPLLKGQLAGKLVITDLGPAFGTNSKNNNPNKVLPTRPFDLASLRKMNADVMLDMQHLDLKTSYLEPLKPFKADLQLNDAVLTLKNIKALTASGGLTGDIGLDGRGSKALWDANVAWRGVRLERWINQKRPDGQPPYIAGRLNGMAHLKGEGKSTAEFLASVDGTIRTALNQGAISHLGIEVAGLDLAESIGVLFEGDEPLAVQCAVVDLHAKNGLFTPRVLVIDTTDTTVWAEGSLSFATEKLNLRVMALPKDFSPLTLRVPLNVTGSFSDPNVALEKKPVGLKLAASILLAILNPLASVLPLLDTGDTEEAKQRAAGCKSLMQKNKAMPVK